MTESSSGARLAIPAIVILALIGVGAFLFLRSNDDEGGANGGGGGRAVGGTNGPGEDTGNPTVLTADEYAAAYEFANTGLGHLENLDFVNQGMTKAESTFRALAEKAPRERMPIQNLAITQTIMVVNDTSPIVKEKRKNPEAFNQAVAAARETLKELNKHDEALTSMLGGLISIRADDLEEGIRQLKSAAETARDKPSYWFALYKACKERNSDEARRDALNAIEKVHQLVPENLHGICELIYAQATSESQGLLETLNKARSVVEPLAPSIKRVSRRDILEMFDNAIEQMEQGSRRGSGIARQIANILKPDIAKRIDQRRLDRDLLEYVLVDFGSDFVNRAVEAGHKVAVEKQIEVSFKNAQTQLPSLLNTTDLKIADINLDGLPDVVVVREGAIEVYSRRQNTSGSPTGDWEVIATAELPEGASLQRVELADLDRDYQQSNRDRRYRVVREGSGVPKVQTPPGYALTDTDLDFIAYGKSGVVLLRNDKVSEEGISFQRKLIPYDVGDAFANLENAVAVAVLDTDHDGDLDLAIGTENRVAIRVNQSTKKEVRFGSGDASVDRIPQGQVVRDLFPVDWNRDIATDIVVVTDGSLGMLQNVLHSRFRWIDLATDLARGGGTAVAVAELNGDAAWDLVLGNASAVQMFPKSPTAGEATTWLSTSSIDVPAQQLRLLDYDNDSYTDAIACSGKARLLRGQPNGDFEVTELLKDTAEGVTACDMGDVDLDGDLDIVLATADGISILSNEGGNKNNWLRMTLRAEPNPEQFPSQRVSMHGYGSTIELKAGARYQAALVSSPVTHFGLGSREAADVMRVIWTDGVPQNMVASTESGNAQPGPKKEMTILAQQYLIGSCPYIYTWNGERFEFFSDCLWAAPLGLQQAEGVFAPTREWEYIKIDGDKLQAQDGEYVLKVTEELWEATYLDEVKLIAVDHPQGTQIFSNEKVGPPNVTQFKIHGARDVRVPISARNQDGLDLLPLLRTQDKNYARAFGARIKQGLTSEHFIEFNLGDIKDPANVTLFMVGWVFPTDTSINIGIDQAGEAPPKPPSILVPDENGKWIEAIPFAGFPGGKTKTIAIDLSNAFKTDDYRVRIASSMELYWDAAFFTDGKQNVQVKQTELRLTTADLQFRGYSKRRYEGSVFADGFGPEDYDYNDTSTIPTWHPMDGEFTRYGDVRPLLTERDDLQVVFGAGDEVTLKFAAKQDEIPDGWVRDFLLYNVGWDKDVRQNTVHSYTVGPLPYEGMKSYTAADTAFPDTAKHREFLKTWQTRRQNLRRFRNWVREFDTSRRKSSQ